MKFYAILCSFLLLASQAFAASSFPAPSGYVNDFAGLLTAEQKQALEAKLTQFEKSSSNEISIATFANLNGDSIDHVAEQLFQQWGIGKKNHDNGVLVVVAQDEHKIRIEVGYGLEGALTDAQSSWIIRDVMQPAFKSWNFYGGLDQAADKIIAATQGEYIPSANENASFRPSLNTAFYLIFFVGSALASFLGRTKSFWAGGVIGAIGGACTFFFGFSLLKIILSILGFGGVGLLFDYIVSRRGPPGAGGIRPPFFFGGFGGGGSGSGGFSGFGGGRSGGGGASGGW